MDVVTLKPCPFCGGTEIARDSKQIGHSHPSYRCGYCGARTATFTNDEAALHAWNTRASADVVEALLCDLAQFLDETRAQRSLSNYPKDLIGWLPYHDELRNRISAALGADQ